jgi:regulator of cell morphogenesis and NO signaling
MEFSFLTEQIMQRYILPLEENILYSYSELKDIHVDRDFIYSLIQVFEDEKSFSPETYRKFSLHTIIDYIQRTHQYYLTKKLCEIEQSINILLKDYEGDHPLLVILTSFYKDYKNHLTEHIKVEEEFVLPFIVSMLKFEQKKISGREFLNTTQVFSLKNFIENHHDTERDLSQVRNTILQYDPPVTNQTPYRILLTQLQVFERDLAIHALIEDYVLIPRALQLEKSLKEKL